MMMAILHVLLLVVSSLIASLAFKSNIRGVIYSYYGLASKCATNASTKCDLQVTTSSTVCSSAAPDVLGYMLLYKMHVTCRNTDAKITLL